MQHDDEITSAELDELLPDATTVDSPRPDSGTEIRLSISVDATTLQSRRPSSIDPRRGAYREVPALG